MSEIKKDLGQFFTPEFISDFMVSLIEKKNSKILDLALVMECLLKSLAKKKFKKITSIEIDKNICKNTLNKSFVSYNFKEKYDVIIGNPLMLDGKSQYNVKK